MSRERKFDRRTFLGAAGGAGILAAEHLLGVPHPENSGPSSFFFAESRTSNPYNFLEFGVSLDDGKVKLGAGHSKYLGHLVTHDPLFNHQDHGILTQAKRHMERYKPVHPRMGDVYLQHKNFAEKAIKQEQIRLSPADQEELENHLAITSTAALLSPLFTKSDFDGNFQAFHPFGSIPAGDNAWFDGQRERLPIVYPLDPRKGPYTAEEMVHFVEGTDRCVHAAAYTYTAHMLAEGRKRNFSDSFRIPNFIGDRFSIQPPELAIIDGLGNVAWGWELGEELQFRSDKDTWEKEKATYTAQDQNETGGRKFRDPPVRSGFSSPDYEADSRANSLGIRAALALSAENNFTNFVRIFNDRTVTAQPEALRDINFGPFRRFSRAIFPEKRTVIFSNS